MPERLEVPDDGGLEQPPVVASVQIRQLQLALKVRGHEARHAAHERDEARKHIKSLNKTVGRQGDTICRLRGDLARTREESSKIERGQLRFLERQTEMLIEQHELDTTRLQAARDEVKQLREELATMTARAERAESLELAEDGEYQDHDGQWHPFEMDRWRPVQKKSADSELDPDSIPSLSDQSKEELTSTS